MTVRACALALVLCACDPGGPSVEQVDAPSPGATLLPLESANVLTPDGGSLGARDGGFAQSDAAPPPPQPFEPYEPAPLDRLPSGELDGVKLEAEWRWPSEGPWPTPPEGVREAIETLRAATAARWTLELSSVGRMRAAISGRGQPLPPKTSLRARADRFGYALVWPNGSRYRLLAPGVLRNVMADRRADVSPLDVSRAEVTGTSERLGHTTRQIRVRSALATVELEVAAFASAGRGGPLVCRLLLDLAGMDPSSEACRDGEVALHAVLTRGDGTLRFDVLEVAAEQKVGSRAMALPPPRARFVTTGLPGTSQAVFLNESELRQLRSEAGSPSSPPPNAPKRGLVADNKSDLLLFLLLDGIVVASVPPWRSVAMTQLPQGAYTLQWRTYSGDAAGPPVAADVPGRITFGSPEPEKPDAG